MKFTPDSSPSSWLAVKPTAELPDAELAQMLAAVAESPQNENGGHVQRPPFRF